MSMCLFKKEQLIQDMSRFSIMPFKAEYLLCIALLAIENTLLYCQVLIRAQLCQKMPTKNHNRIRDYIISWMGVAFQQT